MKNRLSPTQTARLSNARRGLMGFLALSAVLTVASYGQAPSGQADKITRDIEKVKRDSPDISTAEKLFAIKELARAGATQAIPAVEAEFDRTQDKTTKAHIANALVMLGDKNAVYWNFLAGQATLAAETDAPDVVIDSKGTGTLRQFSPDFLKWAKSHNMTPNDAGLQVTYEFPVYIGLLGETADPRAIPILQRALLSPNFLINAMAAKGLAVAQDKGSIPLIIAACQRAPANTAGAIAEALVYFDDPEAQSAVDTYMPREYAKAARDARANGKKPFGYEDPG